MVNKKSKQKKIGLLTLHKANNYGAVLQVYALQKKLSELHDVEIIDYRPKHVENSLSLFRFSYELRSVLRVFKDIFRLAPRYRVINKFNNFIYHEFNLSPYCKNISEIELISNRYDILLSGSDQIWNPEIVSSNASLEPIYLLDFKGKSRRVSYASSMGSYKYKGAELEWLINCLRNYSYISVREENTARFLTDNLDTHVSHVLDPTLLLDKLSWQHMVDKSTLSVNEPYILVYALKKDTLLKSVVSYVKNILGIQVITIDQDPVLNYKPDLHIKDASPYDYVSLFSSATFVITNSFHGTAFSVNFEKDFLVTTPPTGSNRIISLLDSVGLSEQFIESEVDLQSLKVKVCHDISKHKLGKMRLESSNFLQESLDE